MGKAFAYEDHNGCCSKKDRYVGLFFFIEGNFVFSGCPLNEADTYGDFLIYPEGHLEAWDSVESLNSFEDGRKVDYDYYPRGRIVYRKTDDTFIIYYDKCVEGALDRLTRAYEGCNVKTETDEHYCCHACNNLYVE